MTVTVMDRPEKIETQEAVRIVVCPSLRIDPHVGSGGWTPIPKKLNAASMINAKAQFNVARTMMGVRIEVRSARPTERVALSLNRALPR